MRPRVTDVGRDDDQFTVDNGSLPLEPDFKSRPRMQLITIGEVARRAGLNSSAIRYYERLGILPPARREGGKRVYDDGVIDALAIIRFARHLGISLAEIRLLLGGNTARPRPADWRALAERRLEEIDALIAQSERMRRLLRDTLRHQCPKLVERGDALLDSAVTPART